MIGTTVCRPGTVLTARHRGRRSLLAAGLGGLTLTLALAGCGSGSTSGSTSRSLLRPARSASAPAVTTEPSYGSLPSYLPNSSVEADSVLTGTAQRPALTTEGDGVKVQLAGGSVLATVTGPEVPGEGLPYQGPATVCTWTVTLSHADIPVPISVADFSTLDHLGNVYRLSLVAGRPRPPATLAPGQSVTFELRARMITGEGLMRWAPGREPVLASWDFEVEND